MKGRSLPYQKDFKIGILGGGQLGRMLIQAGINYNLQFKVLDPDPQAPCQGIAEFVQGNLRDEQTLLDFGRDCDLITIEIEHVNVAALKKLVAMGKQVFPQPEIIELIQDKRSQKKFYQERNIPTAAFILTQDRADVSRHIDFLPAVHKLGKDGYDGRGVQILRTANDLPQAFDAPGVLEKLVPLQKEVAVLVSRSTTGEVVTFPAVEMEFHPEANLVEFLISPAQWDNAMEAEARALAVRVIEELGMVGLLAVEMFVGPSGELLVNEIAPRPHNSGHHTIEANGTSQYEQHLRAILGWPAGTTELIRAAAMINLLGEPGHQGNAVYEGLEEVLRYPGVHVHLYGKAQTKPFRKMGHVTLVGATLAEVRERAHLVKEKLKVTSQVI